jgi:hypothetical protein
MGFDFFLGSVDVAAQLEGIELLVQLAQLGEVSSILWRGLPGVERKYGSQK